WAGALLGLESRPVLIADSQARIDEARMRLARVGIEELSGYLESGVSGWTQAGFSLAHLPQITAQDLNQRRRDPGLHVLDVRRAGEWEAGHVAEAHLWPLDRFKEALPLVDKTMPMAVHCKSGYRSTIACSLLMRAGYRNVINVVGGFDAWQTAQLLVTKDATIAV
ncbi:MAG TPA: rhodanese-like domain-containing protein, partial [Terriglobales bacterium]|nr:rhodanese-like domain-containing protein [Terriglobales bacterium]